MSVTFMFENLLGSVIFGEKTVACDCIEIITENWVFQQLPNPVHCHPLRDRLVLR